MSSTPQLHLPDAPATPARPSFRIRTTGPSAAPLVVKATGRGSVQPLGIGRFLVAPGDRIALRHLLENHLPALDLRQSVERRLALEALDRGFDGLALTLLQRRYGRETPGPLEVEAVWVAVRETLKSCGLTGVRIRVHRLHEPASGLGYGGILVGFSRRGNALEPTHPLVVLKVRPRTDEGDDFAREARALASVRAALPARMRDLVPVPLAQRSREGTDVLAMGFVPGRPLPLDVSGAGRGGRTARHVMVSVAAALADLQAGLRAPSDRVMDGSEWPGFAAGQPWSDELRKRLAVRPLPLLPSHGDFSPHNVLMRDGRVSGIVDWSNHRPAELPTRDLFHFLITFSRLLDPRTRGGSGAIRRAFVERNPVSAAVRDALLCYGERREVGLPTLAGLFRLHLLLDECGDGRYSPLRTAEDRDAAVEVLDGARETVFTP